MDWRQNPYKRYVLDNGSHMVRYGNANTKTTQLNLIAQIKKSGSLVYELDGLFDESHVMKYFKPHVRGILVDFDKQIEIWDRFVNIKKDMSITYPYQPMIPDQSLSKLFEIMFEYYNLDGFCPIISQKLLAQGTFSFVIDSSHSATYFVPIFDGEVIGPAVKRLEIGGKLLTNHLREMISFKQYDFKNFYILSTKIKESLCYFSMNYQQDMKKPKKALQKYYVLPDFEVKREGYAIDQLNVGFLDAKVALDKERITIPETIFNPANIGLNQDGPLGIIKESLSNINEELRGYFMENIILAGGNSLFQNFYDRLYNQIRSEFPIDWNVNIKHLKGDDVYDGGLKFNQSDDYSQYAFSNAEYTEKGFDNIKNYL